MKYIDILLFLIITLSFWIGYYQGGWEIRKIRKQINNEKELSQ